MSETSFPLEPCASNIIVRRDQRETTSRGGIVIPEASQKETFFGVVLAVGPGHINSFGNRVPMRVKVGDRILFAKLAGDEFAVEGEPILIMPESHVWAVVLNE